MYPIEEYKFPAVQLSEVQKALQLNLPKYFEKVQVEIVQCPDLSDKPYNLATKGFGGGITSIVDLGGVPYLIPLVDRSKVYNLTEIIKKYLGVEKFPEGGYISGSGAGPWPLHGTNCEMVINMRFGPDGEILENKSKIARTSQGKELDIELNNLDKNEARCALLANFMVSSGKSGKILDIQCAGRKIKEINYTTAIRESLDSYFTSKIPVGLAGQFLITKSSTKIHVMRDFSTKPIKTDEEVNEWLKFFSMDPPMLFQSVLVSHDPGYDLRVEHSHGWSLKKPEGGHYHYDLNPQDVEYHGIFSVAQNLWRIDRPKETHKIGRD